MTKTVLQVIQEHNDFTHHERVLVAVSGGVDSMNLLNFLYQHQEILGITLGIAHFNHQQRLASKDEEDGLRQLAKELALPFYTASFSGKFSENEGRKQRYAFFEQVMKNEGYTALVTAHHADDQAETIFMRLLRGSRLRHLVGIRRHQAFGDGELIRPFLHLKKAELPPIFHYEDASNQSPAFLRNRIRQTYLPLLTQENPKLSQHLYQFGEEVALVQEALADLTKELTITDCATFCSQTPAVQHYLLQEYVSRFPDLTLSKAQFEEVWHILKTKANYRHPIKNGYWLVKDVVQFRFEKISPKTDGFALPLVLDYGNSLQIGHFLISYGEPLEKAELVLSLRHQSSLLLRHRQEGDVIAQGKHRKKLRRLFIDDKISLEERAKALIIEQENRIEAVLLSDKTYLSKPPKHDIMKAKVYIQKIEKW